MSTQFSTLFNRYLLTGFADGPVCQIPESPPDLRHKSSISYLSFVYQHLQICESARPSLTFAPPPVFNFKAIHLSFQFQIEAAINHDWLAFLLFKQA
jgi:hypothetical protein